MSAKKTCGSCAAFSALTSECRRNAPQPLLMPKPDGKPAIFGVYPATDKDGWCLEWISDEDST